LTFDFGVEVDKVTICGLVDAVTVVVVTTETVDEAKLLVAVVGTSRIY
jgi:hypothetical protein